LNQDFAGLGGDTKHVKTEFVSNIYRKLYFKDVIGSATLKTGFIESFSDEGVRLADRFRKGGSTFRGFETSGLGPRVIAREFDTDPEDPNNPLTVFPIDNGESLGGKFYAIGTLEVSFPTGLPEEYGILASLFAEFGTLGILDDEELSNFGNPDLIADELSLRASAGLSVFWDSPFGPIRLDFAQILAQEDYDRTESFRFSAGTRF
jgi:outer membrane protein insertion porin family